MSLFDSLKDLGSKIFDVGELAVDNFVFKLHRIVTVVLLLAFSVVTSLGQYVGDPIECIKRDKEIDPKLIDTYCWIHGTYTQQPIEAGKMQTHEKRNHLKFGSPPKRRIVGITPIISSLLWYLYCKRLAFIFHGFSGKFVKKIGSSLWSKA